MSYGSSDVAVAANRGKHNDGNNVLDVLRRANWSGKIPVRLTLADTSLSSGTPPHPQHVLLSRHTFLHLGLETAVRKLHQHSLPTLSFRTSRVVVVQEDDEDNRNDNEENAIAQSSNDKSIKDKAFDATIQKNDTNSDTGSSGSNSSDSNGSNKNEKDRSGDGDSDGEESTVSEPKKVSPYPICWFEDVATQQPLRWQYFVGVLFDSLHHACGSSQLLPCNNGGASEFLLGASESSPSPPSPQTARPRLPWEICVHFGSYPSQQLLELCDPVLGHPCGVIDTVRQTFRNSLKQGFVIRYGNSKEALNLSKQAHDTIWDSIVQGNYETMSPIVYRDDEFDTDATTRKVPTNNNEDEDVSSGDMNKKESMNDQPEDDNDGSLKGIEDEPSPKNTEKNITIDDEKDVSESEKHNKKSSESNKKISKNNLVMVPVRLSVDPTKPMIQKRCEGGDAASVATLGSLLHEWAPSHFGFATTDGVETKDTDARKIQPLSRGIIWRVSGLTPPLTMPLLDLWVALRYPDNFLYVSVCV
mmetsp:Transcript_15966/g.36968  ORF Transcript_15966/g.36968 Transcript_15966/m.36968 type:complete len:529 (+) Transcript_15966:195-1781(+)